MELHLLHTNNASQYLVIAVLFQVSADNQQNPFLAGFWSHLPGDSSKSKYKIGMMTL
jgi:carbonic anhydrase